MTRLFAFVQHLESNFEAKIIQFNAETETQVVSLVISCRLMLIFDKNICNMHLPFHLLLDAHLQQKAHGAY